MLFDAWEGAAVNGRERIGKGLAKLVERGKMSQADVEQLMGRILVCDDLSELADAGLVVEAVVEDLQVKRDLFARLEKITEDDAILATNTSSISVTLIASPLARPERFAGMHFFNPAPVMKLVEVVSGLATADDVAQTLYATAGAWGKVPVHASSTPGFIVNRVARPFYAEALRLFEERVATPATIDALITQCGGFRMGPFALMDMIGHDVNYSVTKSVFDAYYQDPRFRPSITQLELVNAGWLGRKSGRGFFDYSEGAGRPSAATLAVLENAGCFEQSPISAAPVKLDGVLFSLTDGRPARERAEAEGMPTVLYDLMLDSGKAPRIGFTASDEVPDKIIDCFVATLQNNGKAVTRLKDWPGLVVMRTVAMLANEAFEAVMHGVSDEAGIDAAMKFGVNYPLGPVEWARQIGLDHVLGVLDVLYKATGDARYRASYMLRTLCGVTQR